MVVFSFIFVPALMTIYKRHTVTAALPYANGPMHIGHLAGCYLPADIYVRYLRSRGKDVVFICGSDEHGVPITIRARKENITPQQVVDKYHNLMKTSFEQFGISFSIYSRTSSPVHHKTASDFFKKFMIKAYLKNRLPNNITMKRQASFWPIGILQARALIARTPMLMATNANVAAHHLALPTL